MNLKGEVIGINTAIASHGGGNEGVGYSIPINLAQWAMEQLIAEGKVRRGAIGISLAGRLPRGLRASTASTALGAPGSRPSPRTRRPRRGASGGAT